jgi:hypothetical protein
MREDDSPKIFFDRKAKRKLDFLGKESSAIYARQKQICIEATVSNAHKWQAPRRMIVVPQSLLIAIVQSALTNVVNNSVHAS